MEQFEALYIKGFNSGYLLAQHEPLLINNLLLGLIKNNHFVEGLFEGRDQFEREVELEKIEELNRLRNDSRENDLERDHD